MCVCDLTWVVAIDRPWWVWLASAWVMIVRCTVQDKLERLNGSATDVDPLRGRVPVY